MKEIKAIIHAYDSIDKATNRAALATVVRVEGSSYRRMGARMLVVDDGTWVGGISGGCLEGDALKRARLAIARSVPSLVTYDTTEGDAYQVGVGLGCNGVIDVLFTPLLPEDSSNPVQVLKSCAAAQRQTHVLLTVMRLEGDWPQLRAGQVIRYIESASLRGMVEVKVQEQVAAAVTGQLMEKKSVAATFTCTAGEMELFIEVLEPEISMVLVGHQYDIHPFARLFRELGWRVTIVANPQKINNTLKSVADELVEAKGLSQVATDHRTAIVLMSHDLKTDKYNLPGALLTRAPYIGILGPRSRWERICAELREEGLLGPGAELGRVFAPIGLDIGATTPEEIALSVAAEIKACFSVREGGFLRLRKTSIHERG